MRSLTLFLFVFIIVVMASFTPQGILKVTSPAFKEGGMIPAKYSCEGGESSPSIHISGAPSGTKSFALILHDPDAPKSGGFTHWVVWNIDTDGILNEDFKGAIQGMNSKDETGYTGMCPPSGTHHYHFMVYALDTRLELNPQTNKASLESAMEGHILAKGDLVGLYKKTE